MELIMGDKAHKSVIEIIPSPCVGNCCLDEQDICLGCLRHLNEIIGWQECSNAEKKQIELNCEIRRKSSAY
jgi:predicted Fe-S protein YdhL (DUF1289 family)|tara:strand:+ start:439 stop:651 length:213 start_codon:yes stop_codon:yes gene_type:complete